MSRFNSKPSPKYVAAVTALQELLAEENGENDVEYAFLDVVSDLWRESYLQGQHLKAASSRHPCIARLMGKRCPADFKRNELDKRTCPSTLIPHADHLSEWRADDGSRRIVSQPYSTWDTEELRELLRFCDEWGLDVEISAHSWHFPGSTTLVEFKKRKETRYDRRA